MPRNDAPAARPTVAGETPLALLRRARRTNRALAVAHPDAHCELDFTTPLELLVATVLSAQTTDVSVNRATRRLFADDGLSTGIFYQRQPSPPTAPLRPASRDLTAIEAAFAL